MDLNSQLSFILLKTTTLAVQSFVSRPDNLRPTRLGPSQVPKREWAVRTELYPFFHYHRIPREKLSKAIAGLREGVGNFDSFFSVSHGLKINLLNSLDLMKLA